MALNTSQKQVFQLLKGMLPSGPLSPLVGPLDPDRLLLRMPLSSPDGRARTWQKSIRDIAASVNNNIVDVFRDCWLVDAQSGEDFRVFKLDPQGRGGNKWTFQRTTYVLLNPHDTQMRTHEQLVLGPVICPSLSHRCQVSFPTRYACVNPGHAHNEDQSINDSRKGCGNGCAALCPHIPLCIFTDKANGRWLPCLNDQEKLPRCDIFHDGQCWGPNAVQVHGGHVSYAPPSTSEFSGASSETTQSHYGGFGEVALVSEVEDVVRDAQDMGEWNLGRRRFG